jgi:hypothetical protein
MVKPKRVPGSIRLEQAWKLWQSENRGKPANITAIAKLAGILRPNVYAPRHMEVLKRIQETRPERTPRAVGTTRRNARSDRIEAAELERDVALYLWMEKEGAPKRSVTKAPFRPLAAAVILQKIESASKLQTAAGKFLKKAVLSYLGTGTVSLAGLDLLDVEHRALLLHFLELRSRPNGPTMEAYEHLRQKLST